MFKKNIKSEAPRAALPSQSKADVPLIYFFYDKTMRFPHRADNGATYLFPAMVCDVRTGDEDTATIHLFTNSSEDCDGHGDLVAVIPKDKAIYLRYLTSHAADFDIRAQIRSGDLSPRERKNLGDCRLRPYGATLRQPA